ncbi:MAG: MBOAT family protein [Lachnospiraceae bacterium]|nr:MBOAT family protein [Lachnospiraceae bacterium]
MAYTSFNFMLFLILIVVIYYVCPKRMQWLVLLTASYFFYLSAGVAQILFIVPTTLITYGSALWMQKIRDNYVAEIKAAGADLDKEQKKERKKAAGAKIHKVQVLTVLLCLVVLAVVKYTNSLIGNVNILFGIFGYNQEIPFINIIVPLGISFYTFQSMGYVIDIGRGKYEAERHLGRYALFVSFFPTIVQGPINRYDELGVQFSKAHKLEYNNIKFGIQLMLWGFFKKLVIADRAAPMVAEIFGTEYMNYSGIVFLFGMFVYAVQIYTDFSGGIDIARGAAQVLDIYLPQNFERPYFSQSVAEYWRRWHITLGAWMREYVFYPVMLSKFVTKVSKFFRQKGMKNAAKRTPSVITPFVVFFLIGIWHGASWQYIAFGLYNATIVAGGVLLEPLFKKMVNMFRINTEVFSWKLFRIVRTFMVLGISKMLVCAPGLGAAVYMIKKIFTDLLSASNLDFIFGLNNEIYRLGVNEKNVKALAFATVVLLVVSILQECGIKMRETIAKQNLIFRWILYLGILYVILVFGIYGPGYDAAQFIYQEY